MDTLPLVVAPIALTVSGYIRLDGSRMFPVAPPSEFSMGDGLGPVEKTSSIDER
jgi:hypothetical protein